MPTKNMKKIGDDAEKAVVAILEAQQYTVCRTWRQYSPIAPGKWISKEADFFGCYDIIAFPHPSNPDPRPYCIQVTAEDYAWAKKEKKIRESFPNGWNDASKRSAIWVSRKKKMVSGMTRKEFAKWKRFDARDVHPSGGLGDIKAVPYV